MNLKKSIKEFSNSRKIKKYIEKGFSKDQIEEIELGLKFGIDIEKYASKDFDCIKMRQIREKLIKQNKINMYIKSNFKEEQIEEIILGLEKGLDVEKYAKLEYLNVQMRQIRLGLENGVDVEKYSNVKFSSEKMRQIRLALEKGLNIEKYIEEDFDSIQLEQIRLGLENEVDVEKYAYTVFNFEKMRQIRLALEKGLNIEKYIKEKFYSSQLEQIRLGLESGVDIEKYSNIEFSSNQMKEIRLGLEKKLDVEKYLNVEFNSKQMKEIRLGLEVGLDVEKYANNNLNNKQMEKIRLKLERNQHLIYTDIPNEKEKIVSESLSNTNKIFEKVEESNHPKNNLWYENAGFNPLQIKEIKLGLEENIDVSGYADPKYNYVEMKDIREGLVNYKRTFVEKKNYFKNIKKEKRDLLFYIEFIKYIEEINSEAIYKIINLNTEKDNTNVIIDRYADRMSNVLYKKICDAENLYFIIKSEVVPLTNMTIISYIKVIEYLLYEILKNNFNEDVLESEISILCDKLKYLYNNEKRNDISELYKEIEQKIIPMKKDIRINKKKLEEKDADYIREFLFKPYYTSDVNSYKCNFEILLDGIEENPWVNYKIYSNSTIENDLFNDILGNDESAIRAYYKYQNGDY